MPRRARRINYYQIANVTGQSLQPAHQIAPCPDLIYPLFTRKSEGQGWRRVWRLAAGREQLRISAFRDRIEGTGGLFCLEVLFTPARHGRDVICAELAIFAGTTLDELVEWMVEDVSLGRRDRRGPKLS
jgi:hypothetical protein